MREFTIKFREKMTQSRITLLPNMWRKEKIIYHNYNNNFK